MEQNYEDWDNDNNSVTSYYVTPPTSPIIQPVYNADETKNFSHNNVDINLSSLSDLMSDPISFWCDSSTLLIDDSISPQNNIHHNFDSVYTPSTQLKNLPTISAISSTSLEYLTSLSTSKPPSSATLSSSPSSTITTSTQPLILSKVDISQCQFGYTNDAYSTIINANYRGDVAFLYKVGDDLNLNGGGEISCCLNRMSDEVSIPFNQLCGFKVTSEDKIIIKFKPNFKRTYYRHLGGYPYLLDPTILQTDPSGGKFNCLCSLTLIPDTSEDSSKLPKIESEIERLWFNKNGVRNELAKDNRQKLYITCVFPTERRAIAVPMDSSYHKLLLVLESRFSLAMDNVNLRFRNKHGDVVALKGDDCWEMAKSDASGKNLARLELLIW